MSDDIRRARVAREMEELFLPVYDANNLPSADKRAAYALEHIAFRMGRIELKIDQLIAAAASIAAHKR